VEMGAAFDVSVKMLRMLAVSSAAVRRQSLRGPGALLVHLSGAARVVASARDAPLPPVPVPAAPAALEPAAPACPAAPAVSRGRSPPVWGWQATASTRAARAATDRNRIELQAVRTLMLTAFIRMSNRIRTVRNFSLLRRAAHVLSSFP
jgi:hypothetical protein